MEDVIKYRHETRDAYEYFRVYLNQLNAEIESSVVSDEYEKKVKRLIVSDLIPKATEFQIECKNIRDKLFADILKKILSLSGGSVGLASVAVTLFAGCSIAGLFTLGCGLGGILAPSIIDYKVERRNIERRNALFYLMKL